MSIRNSDIIIFSLSRWDASISSPSFSLAREFARNNRVFYIDHPFSLKDVLKGIRSPRVRSRWQALVHGTDIYRNPPGLPPSLTIVTPRITLPINFVPDGKLYDALSKYNDREIHHTIRRIVADYDVKRFVYLNAFDPYFCRDFPDDIKPSVTVYQSMDDLSQVPYTARHGIRLEEEIVRKFDITLTTSRELRRLKSTYSNHVYFHPNAADFSNFEKALKQSFPRPEALKGAEGRKVIGYVGNIESRIDYVLLKKILDAHPDKVLMMVGPVGTEEHRTIALTEHPNVIMAGPKKIGELPAYLHYMDCALIPFKKNTLTRSIYPLKVNEYLAAGRPVVATDFSEDIVSFAPEVSIAYDHDQYVNLIDQAIENNNQEEIDARVRIARRNTWTARVEEFWRIVEQRSARSTKQRAGRLLARRSALSS